MKNQNQKMPFKERINGIIFILLIGIPCFIHIERLSQIPPRPAGHEQIGKMLNSKAKQIVKSEDLSLELEKLRKSGVIDFWYNYEKRKCNDRAVRQMVASSAYASYAVLIGTEFERENGSIIFFGLNQQKMNRIDEVITVLSNLILDVVEAHLNWGWYLRSLWKKLTLSKDPPEPFEYLIPR